MRPYILAETNYKSTKDQKYDVAILPWGATEAHNYHLPYGSDTIEADSISAESARVAWEQGARVIVLPTIPYGVNTGQHDILLDMNIYPSTQMVVLTDIIEVLDRQGINKLVILNCHGGNDFRQIIRELGIQFPDMFLCQVNFYQALDKEKYFDEDGDHADEMETSMLLYLHPELVLPKNEAGDGNAKRFTIEALNQNWAWAERKWSEVTEDTGIGNPKNATAQKGKLYFEDLTKTIGDFLVELAGTDLDKMYK
jgi:creatinine amidohydrolase